MITLSKSIQNSFGKFFINTSLIIMMCVNLSEATSEITNQIVTTDVMTTTSKNNPTTPSK